MNDISLRGNRKENKQKPPIKQNTSLTKQWITSLLLLLLLLLLPPWRIRLPGMCPFKLINSEMWILQTVCSTPSTGDQPCRKAATYTGQHQHRINGDIHVSSGIPTHDPSIWLGEGNSCPRPCGKCDIMANFRITREWNVCYSAYKHNKSIWNLLKHTQLKRSAITSHSGMKHNFSSNHLLILTSNQDKRTAHIASPWSRISTPLTNHRVNEFFVYYQHHEGMN
jgi:hypothetical protein